MSTKQTMSWSSVLAAKVVGSVPSGAATTGADRILREASVCRVQHMVRPSLQGKGTSQLLNARTGQNEVIVANCLHEDRHTRP